MSFDDVSLERLRRRRSEKWSSYGPDVLPAFYAEMDFDPAPAITAVLSEAVALGDLGYPYRGPDLRTAFAGFASRRWNWDVDPDTVVAIPDVMVGVAEFLRGLTSPGADVAITTPVYPPFFTVITEVERQIVEVPLEGDALPLAGIRSAFEAGAQALLLCNPHNPTGYVATRDELLAVAELAAFYDAVVIADEIHAPLVLPGAAHVPFGSVARGVTLTSTSKGWNLAGLKCGLAVAPRELLDVLPAEVPDRVGHLGVLASIAALNDGEAWLDELLAYLDATRAWLPGLLAEKLPGIRYRPGDATYLAWLDCRALGLGDDPAAHFLEHGRVALASGPEFGGRGFARLNLGTSRALIAEAVDRMARA